MAEKVIIIDRGVGVWTFFGPKPGLKRLRKQAQEYGSRRFTAREAEEGFQPFASLYSVRQSPLILCKHLRCGQLPSAGPRQKEGAASAQWDNWLRMDEC
jgi:hypothetical protein